MQKISTWLLKCFGWKAIPTFDEPLKSVICVAPHTSNWDFIIGKLTYWSLGREASFLMKKSWFFFPIGYILRAMGGVAIDRSKRTSVTQQMVDEFNKRDSFHLAITPEGTRSFNNTWKMGFYNIAKMANIPIQIAYIDYKKKEMGIKYIFYTTNNQDDDMKNIHSFYEDVTARFPEKFHNQ